MPDWSFVRKSGPVLLVILILSPLTVGEEVVFRRGGSIHAVTRVEGDSVQIDTPGGPYFVPKDEIAAIRPNPTPIQEWPQRRADRSTPEAIWWAIRHGLTDEAIALLRESPSASPTTARLASTLDRLEAHDWSGSTPNLPQQVGAGDFQLRRGRFVQLWHQHDEADARERVELMDRVVLTFYFVWAWHGLELPPPRGPLIQVYHARGGDYRTFLRSDGAALFLETKGYYHPTRKITFAYDARDDLKRPATDGEDGPRRRALWEAEWRARDHAAAAHEIVHALVDLSGLEPHPGTFPTWLHEGMAMRFEAVRGGRWAGFGQPPALRLSDWRADRRPSLPDLVRDRGLGRGYNRRIYAQAWALTDFLWTDRPEEFVAYIDLLRARRGPDAVRAFQEAFGADWEAIQAQWLRSMANRE
jgi:hypothetical protein